MKTDVSLPLATTNDELHIKYIHLILDTVTLDFLSKIQNVSSLANTHKTLQMASQNLS